jgi:hypothetical protein
MTRNYDYQSAPMHPGKLSTALKSLSASVLSVMLLVADSNAKEASQNYGG